MYYCSLMLTTLTVYKSKGLPLQRWRGTCRHSSAVSLRAVGSPHPVRSSSTHPREAPSDEGARSEVPPPSGLPALSLEGIEVAPGVGVEGMISTYHYLSYFFPITCLLSVMIHELHMLGIQQVSEFLQVIFIIFNLSMLTHLNIFQADGG